MAVPVTACEAADLPASASWPLVIEPVVLPAMSAGGGPGDGGFANTVRDDLVAFQHFVSRSPTGRPVSGLLAHPVIVAHATTNGREVDVEGVLVRTAPHGLSLSLGVTGLQTQTFRDERADVHALATRAAEWICGRAYPASFVIYLIRHGRREEAPAFARSALPMADASERPGLLLHWGVALGILDRDPLAQDDLYRRALAEKPDLWPAYANLMGVDMVLGREEDAWRIGRQMSEVSARSGEAVPGDDQQEVWWLRKDYRAGLRQVVADEKAGAGSTDTSENALGAVNAALLHDDEEAAAQLAIRNPSIADGTIPAARHFVDGQMALRTGNLRRGLEQMELFDKDFADPTVASTFPDLRCWVAPAEEMAGHRTEADAALAAGGHLVDCARFRGDILDGRGRWHDAQRAYAAAVATAPDLPAAYHSWGLALARHGDLAGAMARLAAAHARGPDWAEPLRAGGDVLVRQGHRAEALAAYDQALSHAPAWDALRQAGASAAAGSGRGARPRARSDASFIGRQLSGRNAEN